jgi:hypothetical protein
VSGRHPPLTTHRRLGLGSAVRHGHWADYRVIEIGEGEPHLIRDELGVGLQAAGPGRALFALVHITDLQLADVQSPTRFEFLNAGFADPRYAGIIPVQRPQEALTAHAVDATLRTLGGAVAPATGLLPQLAVTTGDAIDNAQWNELQAFLALFDGGLVNPDSGGSDYEGVQSPQWPGDIFWRPDGPGPDGPDLFLRELGFPVHPGLLQRALREFSAAGLSLPWLSCFGNHEALNQGVGTQTPGLAAALTGSRPGCRRTSITTMCSTCSPRTPRRSWPARTGRSRRIPSAGRSAGGTSSTRTCGPGHGRSGTASPNATGWMAPPTTSTTPRRCGSSRSTPTAWPEAPPGAWTASRPAGWRTGCTRCIRPTADRTGPPCAPAMTIGW